MEKITRKRVWLFLGFAFGISWLTALVLFLTGGLQNSPVIFMISGMPITLALVLLSTAYMFGPAIANFLTRWITKEGKENLWLKPHFDRGRWVHWLAAWFLPGILTILGAVVFFLIFPQYFDSELIVLREQMEMSGAGSMSNLWLIVVLQTFQAMLISPLLNAVPTFGEEFGWRGYLQPKLMALGPRKAILLTGVIWGIWHWPVILMGHNYGLGYFGEPFLGPLAMVWFTLTLSALFGWVTIKANNVWPAVIAHAAINGIAAIGFLMIRGEPSTLLGPAPTGVIAGLGLTLCALIIFLHPKGLTPKPAEQQL